MLNRDLQSAALQSLDQRFGTIVDRVRAMSKENSTLKARIRELEQELREVRSAEMDSEEVRGKHEHLREKIEHVLQSLETLEIRK